ncbi:hypothetical protein ACLIBG_09200 [Virgibacillus sp. W0181]|uniref:hypothetical protein n=1 Tax=Virgibacillus sp. W0181 TaxID=3391581 RepID=UPI003F462A08
MPNFRVLKMLDIFQALFEKFNINYPILRHILAIKLLMDQRRVPTIFEDTKDEKKSSFIKSLWIYVLYGFILVFFLFGNVYMLQMSIIFGIALFILMTALIADFSPVMLDVRDRTIIGTKPIDNRTIGVAKFIHVLIYMIQLTGAFTIIPIIFMLFVQGIVFTMLFIVMLVLFMLFIIALTSLTYIFVLKLFSGEQLKSMINYIQIIFAIGIIIGYQIIIRAYGVIDLNAAYLLKWWHILLPPMWFAAPFELIINKNISTEIIVLSLLSAIVPVITFALYYWFIPAFESNLQKLLETASSKKRKKFSAESLWKGLLCRTEKSRAYFQFVYKIVDREREFKLKVYPSLGIGLVLPFIFIFSEVGFRTFAEVAASNLYLCIYLMHIFIGVAIYTFQFSGNFKGAWIFTAVSTGDTISPQLYGAVMKVFLAKLYFPMFILVGIPYYFLFDKLHVIDLTIVFVSAVVQALLSYQMTVESKYPFSLPFDRSDNESMTKAFLLMLLTVPFVILHFLSAFFPFILYIYFVLLCIAATFLWRKSFVNTK